MRLHSRDKSAVHSSAVHSKKCGLSCCARFVFVFLTVGSGLLCLRALAYVASPLTWLEILVHKSHTLSINSTLWQRPRHRYYDFNEPLAVPDGLRGSVDYILMDPPYLVRDICRRDPSVEEEEAGGETESAKCTKILGERQKKQVLVHCFRQMEKDVARGDRMPHADTAVL